MNWYQSLFKCRLCGETYTSSGTGEDHVAMYSALHATGVGVKGYPNGPALTEVHVCKNGGYGIADFLGFKKEEVMEKVKAESLEDLGVGGKPDGKESDKKASDEGSGAELSDLQL